MPFLKDKKDLPNEFEKKESQKNDGKLVVDVYETDANLCIRAPIAGVDSKDIETYVENGILTIKGERKEPEENEIKKYFLKECYFGKFKREIILPENIDIQGIEASLKKGVLIIKFPKTEELRRKKIKIFEKEEQV